MVRDTSDRRQQISRLAKELGSVQVATLAKRFGVSVQTVRKDLRFLANRGVMELSYGGAINLTAESAVEIKRSSHAREKGRIGRVAAAMVSPGDSIVLDSGTTTLQIAHFLPDDESITVLTNDIDILWTLAAKERINVMVLGGGLRRKNRAFYGAQTVAALGDLRVDKLFLGVDGLDVDYGITTHYEPEAMLNRQMVAGAREVIAVTDSSKFGRACLHRIINLDDIHHLITEGPVPQDIRAASERLGFGIRIA